MAQVVSLVEESQYLISITYFSTSCSTPDLSTKNPGAEMDGGNIVTVCLYMCDNEFVFLD